jgi:hypothetical protein
MKHLLFLCIDLELFLSLLEIAKSTSVPKNLDVHLVDKRGEDYVKPPAPAYIAFSGQGSTLKSDSTKSATTSESVFTDEVLSSQQPFVIDNSLPITTLQIRTHTGQKLKIRYVINKSVCKTFDLIVYNLQFLFKELTTAIQFYSSHQQYTGFAFNFFFNQIINLFKFLGKVQEDFRLF